MSVNRVYPSILESLLTGSVDLTSVGLRLVLLADTWAYDATDETLADITAGFRIGTIATLAGTVSASAGVLSTDTALTTIASVPVDTDHVGFVLLCTHGATDADRLLVAVFVQQGDTTPIDVITDTGDVRVTFPNGRLLRI